jgi:spore coat polysaccharide biosynthesis predicted glycosyltransferase SpsG/CMP-N-acetylneuraminic acid synthetase
MSEEAEPICLVPARGTEPGLPKKNFKRLDGKPLIAHTVETALACDAFEDVYVSTESETLADVARDYGATVPFRRPERLSDADVLLHDVVTDALERLAAAGHVTYTDTTPVVVLQPNVPFRRANDITAALNRFEHGTNAVISVVEETGFYWRERDGRLQPSFAERTVRDDLDTVYRETGSINVTTPELLATGTRVGDSPGYVVTDRLSALAVDSVFDLWLAERLADGPRIVFRVDGGGELGMGHVSRCHTLAAELRDLFRCRTAFVSDAAYSAGVDRLRDAGHEVHAVDDASIDDVEALDPDVVFLDVLDTDTEAVRRLSQSVAAVISLEATAATSDAADFVIDPISPISATGDNHLSGPEYLVLREEFRGHGVDVPDRVDRVLFTFGGSDPARLSIQACRAVADDDTRDYRLVLGPDYGSETALADVLDVCEHVTVERAVDDMGAQMAWADIAVASGGRTAFELAATGTPAVIIAQNDREHQRMTRFEERGIIEYLGHAATVSPADIRDGIETLAADHARRQRLSDQGQSLVDGDGTRRILDLVHDMLIG